VFSLLSQLTREIRNTAANVTLLAFAAERRAATPTAAGRPVAAADDRYFLPARRSAANPPHTMAVVEWWDRQIDGQADGRTLDRFIHPAPHTMRVGS